MRTRLPHSLRTPRPRRGSPAGTRARLVAAAAGLFNQAGYHGTDSNRIAEAAGYATGTFYKHFKDKREIFVAAYETWVSSEWKAVEAELAAGGTREDLARRLVELGIRFHMQWRGLRSSLVELVFTDREVRAVYRAQRRRQLGIMAELRKRIGARPQRREDDAILLFTTERTYDAVAHGELGDLGLDRQVFIENLVKKMIAALE
jgi:AcrR family transcriptional regulator